MRRLLLSTLGWLLVLVGLVLYPLPGPGLVVMVMGLALLSRYDPWAARRLEPVQRRALVETRRTVATWPRLLVTAWVTVALGVSGLVWLADPAQPTWWALPSWTWLPGGFWAGVGQIVSGVAGLAIVVWARLALVPAGSTSRDMNTLSGSGR
ncbi:MAG: PGPGW domain-containing protein [Actinomycetota bacterium]|nr:PGPGW domain-containing protein [Actinomycetota bacterium]